MAVARQLVVLLSRGGEEPPEPLGRRARVALLVASDDEVGLDVATAHLQHVSVHRVKGGHRALLREHGARAVGELISKACPEGSEGK